jgi:membrane-associated phospholipid phosphatase
MSATVDGDVVSVVDERQQGVPWARIGVLVGSGLALALVLVGIGRAITSLPRDNAFLVWENGVNTWFVSIRTPTLDTMTHVGSYLAETITCIALLLVAMAVCRWRTGRWFEAWVVCAAIVGELWVFLLVTFLVDRARPVVPHLDAAPPTSSFPSGHTGAAVALYGCIAVVLWRTSRRGPWVRALIALCCIVPVVVAVSRVYRGMHHVSDVVFGAIGGGVWLLVVVTVLLGLSPHRDEAQHADGPQASVDPAAA